MEDRRWWSSAVGVATLWGEMDIEIVISHAENGRRTDVVAMGDWHEQEELILVFGGHSTEGVGGNISAVLMLSVVFVDHELLLEKASPSSPSLTVGVKDILAPSRSFPRISVPFLCVSHPCHEPSPIFKPSARIPLSSSSMWLDYTVAAASILLVRDGHWMLALRGWGLRSYLRPGEVSISIMAAEYSGIVLCYWGIVKVLPRGRTYACIVGSGLLFGLLGSPDA
ncbi:hypothetical protein EDD85DRAFT_792804 [Armillaria nabsnona]|nr:hypothetical protein EDD85DRAFT_792804 [Armillaria nabsnona]